MYYPIIDKLKEVMADITSVKDKEPLVIEGTITSQTGGVWVGDQNVIKKAFYTSFRPVYFSLLLPSGAQYVIPIISCSNNYADSALIYFNGMTAYGSIQFNTNTFNLNVIGS